MKLVRRLGRLWKVSEKLLRARQRMTSIPKEWNGVDCWDSARGLRTMEVIIVRNFDTKGV
jgi:hypothetical protein